MPNEWMGKVGTSYCLFLHVWKYEIIKFLLTLKISIKKTMQISGYNTVYILHVLFYNYIGLWQTTDSINKCIYDNTFDILNERLSLVVAIFFNLL